MQIESAARQACVSGGVAASERQAGRLACWLPATEACLPQRGAAAAAMRGGSNCCAAVAAARVLRWGGWRAVAMHRSFGGPLAASDAR